MRLNRTLFLAAASLFLIAPLRAVAQEPPPPYFAGAVGLFQFELDGNGLAPMIAARAGTPLSTVLLVEGGLVAARPGQDSGTSTILIPEAQLQLSLPFTGLNPYMGLGAGAAVDLRGSEAGGTQADLTISGSIGLRAWLFDRFGLTAEFRGRGIGADFASTSAEYTLGVAWLR